MWIGLYNLIHRLATWPVVALLFIANVIFNQGFSWRQSQFDPQIHLLDTRFFYNPTKVQKLLEMLGESGRQKYAITELSLDLIFPLIYGSLLAVFLFRLHSGDIGKSLIMLPLLTMSADWLENGTAAYLALSFDGKSSTLAWVGAIFTATKWVSGMLCLLLILKNGLAGVFHLSKTSSTDKS